MDLSFYSVIIRVGLSGGPVGK
eukprot:COSAG06_NODE_24760_length_653_cov_1.054152_1_plen_21_part_10